MSQQEPKAKAPKTKAKVETIAGHRLPEPKLATGAIWLGFLYVGLPVLALGGLMDLAAQTFFGACTGLWCAGGR
jgi:hypothetical protein